METKYLIFDFDGVLGDTKETSIQTRLNLKHGRNREEVIAQMDEYFDNKPSHTRNHNLKKEEIEKFGYWVMRFADEMKRLGIPLFRGFIEEIKKIPNTKIAVVSTGGSAYVLPSMKSTGLHPTHILTFEDHHSKEEKIEAICRDWGVGVKDVYYFTDSRADVFELEDFLDRKKIIGVSWGYCGYEKLRELLEEGQILKEFNEVHKILK